VRIQSKKLFLIEFISARFHTYDKESIGLESVLIFILNSLGYVDGVLTFFIILASILILVLFTTLNTQTVTITKSSPSLMEYKRLQFAYPNTIKCPCSNIANRYETFVSLYPILHQVCSSDFVNDFWISMLITMNSGRNVLDWHSLAARRFRFLSSLCQLANKTANDAVHRFTSRSFMTPNLITESDFITQLNTTLSQFTRSVVIQFGLLVNTVHLFIQVDQPFTRLINAEVILSTAANEVKNDELPTVCIRLNDKIVFFLFAIE
jgi:hypothetical protein